MRRYVHVIHHTSKDAAGEDGGRAISTVSGLEYEESSPAPWIYPQRGGNPSALREEVVSAIIAKRVGRRRCGQIIHQGNGQAHIERFNRTIQKECLIEPRRHFATSGRRSGFGCPIATPNGCIWDSTTKHRSKY